jgi:hypothetical protein
MMALLASIGGLVLFGIIAAGYLMLVEPDKLRLFFKNVAQFSLGLVIVFILIRILCTLISYLAKYVDFL